MEARSLPAALGAPSLAPVRADARATAVPWPLVLTLFAATSISIGIIWDISWHMSIGRDTFWTPAHMAVYVGGIVGGLANAWIVLRTTFRGSEAERGRAVGFWGFRGPLGSFVSILGAGAMLTSAPFDDWWHNAYGLDVEILSPPHVVLLLGILGIVLGAMLTALAYQNAAEAEGAPPERLRAYRWALAYAAGIWLTMATVAILEYTNPVSSHGARYYRAAAFTLPLHLAVAARALRLRWPATATAAIYMALFAAMTWILPLFPATPKLGPIYQPITHMVPLGFPLLLVVPALGVDLLMRRLDGRVPTAALAALLAVAFLALFLAVQWPMGAFLLSRASHNWFFAGDNWDYGTPPTSLRVRGLFPPNAGLTPAFVRGMGWALATAFLSSWLGLAWGAWMRRVRR